jgi:hypothetical protein
MIIRLFPIAILLVTAGPAFPFPDCPASLNHPQMLGSGSGTATGQTWNFVSPRPFFGPPVTGAPFSEQLTQSRVTVTPGGARLNGSSSAPPMIYRDSQGRTRTDQLTRPFGPAANPESRIASLASIRDPVAGYEILLDPIHQAAYRIPFCTYPPPQAQTPAASTPNRNPGVTVTEEDLGTQTMFGVTVSGQRTTTTWAPGTYRNNDATVVTSEETWASRQYGQFQTKRTDPNQESTTTMKTFSTAEPDPSLFQIPAGYQVVDEPTPFTITIHYGN